MLANCILKVGKATRHHKGKEELPLVYWFLFIQFKRESIFIGQYSRKSYRKERVLGTSTKKRLHHTHIFVFSQFETELRVWV